MFPADVALCEIAMKATYKHTNIIARDWRRLAQFYQDVFECAVVPPERDLAGTWLDNGTGVSDAHLEGAHLRLPGHGDRGPTLEIYQYTRNEPRAATAWQPQSRRAGAGDGRNSSLRPIARGAAHAAS